MDIYVLVGREQLGPFTLEEISDKLVRGELSASTLARFEGRPEWVPLGTIPGINVSSVPVAGSASRSDEAHASQTDADIQHRFYRQVAEAFRTAVGRLMEPFDTLRQTVEAKQVVDTIEFFRLFLGHAARFNDDCASAFATVLRQSAQLDATRATTVKQLTKEIRSEAFDACDVALENYHRTVNALMGGVDTLMTQVDREGTPMGTMGGALLGGFAAGKGSRAVGAAVGGFAAHLNAIRTMDRQLARHVQAFELIELAERAAPEKVAEYLHAVAGMPEALVDLLGAKCFGAAVDMHVQQQCVRTCVERIGQLNERAAGSIHAMYEQIERATAQAAKAEEKRQAKAREAQRRRNQWLLLSILFALIIAAITGATLQWYNSVEEAKPRREFERWTTQWLLEHPGRTPLLPDADAFIKGGYSFRRNVNGTIELWKNGRPVDPNES